MAREKGINPNMNSVGEMIFMVHKRNSKIEISVMRLTMRVVVDIVHLLLRCEELTGIFDIQLDMTATGADSSFCFS